MSLVHVKVIEGQFDDIQKHELIERLTDAVVEIEGEHMRAATWVVIEEVRSGHVGVAGRPITTAEVRTLAAGLPVMGLR
jgi:4-oxalocrotonate tautomerase